MHVYNTNEKQNDQKLINAHRTIFLCNHKAGAAG